MEQKKETEQKTETVQLTKEQLEAYRAYLERHGARANKWGQTSATQKPDNSNISRTRAYKTYVENTK